MTERRGDTLLFHTPPVIAAQAAAGGKKESEGPLAAGFDELTTDNRLGQCSWEAAEKQLQLRAARLCLQKAGLPAEQVDLALAGDLQAQCTASGYALRELGVPFAGLFGACSTMAEALALGGRGMGLVGSNIFGRESLAEIRVNAAQDLGDRRGETNVSLLGNPGFAQSVRGAKVGTTALQLGAGLSVPVGTKGTIYVNGNADIRDGSSSVNGSVGYRYDF